jgi:radical SAM superfamily enzyme YgiQ (UPF0313 family)
MAADITIVNLNMLYVRYFDAVERERHLPLGPLYVAAALEKAGFSVDFRDYQLHDADELFTSAELARFLSGAARVVGVSCMANLLPFTLLALRDYKAAHPESVIVLGGVGTKAVERQILERFPWIDVIVRGEAELSAPALVGALTRGNSCNDVASLRDVPGISYRDGDTIVETARPPRITALDSITPPAYHLVDVRRYSGFGVITSRGCPYPCTFCSVAPVWDLASYHRSARSVVAEMKDLHERTGTELFLFQDEFFVSGRERVLAFCEELEAQKLDVMWKAFGRINLTDEKMMRAMVDTGCVEIRFGVESGSNRVLELTRKGFTAEESVEVVTRALSFFRRVDLFYVWGFPFETMDDLHASLFQMVSFRMLGARVLPSLLCLLPQTEIFREHVKVSELEFAPDLFPEYMVTGHEVSRLAHVEIRPEHQHVFDFVKEHPDVFPGFFHVDLAANVRPKLRALQELGFYPASSEELAAMESCGAHSPRLNVAQRELATRA